MTLLDYLIVIGFLSCMAVAGLWISRLIKDSDDFFVAGRELTPFILAATITASNLSMFHIIGMGGTTFKNGVSIIWQNWTGDIALVLSGIFVLPIMRRLRVRSIPEFLEIRYSRGMRTLIGGFWALRLTIYLGLLLYIAATTAMAITAPDQQHVADAATSDTAYFIWLLVFATVAILYSAVGGAWAVAIMDSVQFLVMLTGLLVVFPIAMHLSGGLPALLHDLRASSPQHLNLVPQSGDFNWLFIASMMLLGFKWSSIDQSILQRAFGAKSPRVGAKGMVIAGIITTPMALLYILPGLAVAKLHPQPFGPDNNPDLAIPWLLSTQLPLICKGLLGFVLCGLVAAQVSVVTGDINSVATLFTSDVYRTLRKVEPTQRQLLRVVRTCSLASGAFMILFAMIIHRPQFHAGAVNINLFIVGLFDMPLFVITVIYGLAWRRTNWQGALAGFVGGGLCALSCYAMTRYGFWLHDISFDRRVAPVIGGVGALIITPIVTLLTSRSSINRDAVFKSMFAHHDDGDASPFSLIPASIIGKLGAITVLLGFLVFLIGIFGARWALPAASTLAVAGMIVVFVGGIVRVYSP
jgi:solute:Na+ symporter, SSS family